MFLQKQVYMSFYGSIELALDGRCKEEAQVDKTRHKEKNVELGVYLKPNLFQSIQKKYLKSLFMKSYVENGSHIIHGTGKQMVVTLVVRNIERSLDFIICWFSNEKHISCGCFLLNFKGYLHALVSHLACGVYEIPSQLILGRWSKNGKSRHEMYRS